MDPAFALLYEHVTAADASVRLHAIMGLAIAYAGTQKEQVRLGGPLPGLTRLPCDAGLAHYMPTDLSSLIVRVIGAINLKELQCRDSQHAAFRVWEQDSQQAQAQCRNTIMIVKSFLPACMYMLAKRGDSSLACQTAHVWMTEAGLHLQVRELLLPLVADTETSMEIGGAAALALGLVFISSQDEDAVGAALQVRDDSDCELQQSLT